MRRTRSGSVKEGPPTRGKAGQGSTAARASARKTNGKPVLTGRRAAGREKEGEAPTITARTGPNGKPVQHREGQEARSRAAAPERTERASGGRWPFGDRRHTPAPRRRDPRGVGDNHPAWLSFHYVPLQPGVTAERDAKGPPLRERRTLAGDEGERKAAASRDLEGEGESRERGKETRIAAHTLRAHGVVLIERRTPARCALVTGFFISRD